MPIDLSHHQWPERDTETRSKPEGRQLVASARETFVSEGTLLVRAIDFNGRMRALPRESSAITALGYDEGVVYGATSGEQSWLFQYALLSYCEAALPLCPIPDCTEVRGMVVAGHRAWAAANHAGEGRIVEISGLGLPGDIIQEWGMPRPRFETAAVPVPGQRIVRLVRSRVEEAFYGLTAPGGVLFSFRPDTREVRVLGEVDPVKFFGPVLIEDYAGRWYTFGTLGRMRRYDPATATVEDTGVRVASFPGRGPYARISAVAYDPDRQRLYAGDTEGLLSVISLEDESVTPLGKPVPLGGVDHLVVLRDGRLYGVAGGRDGMSHLFLHDPRTGGLRDLGVCCATVEKGWYGYRFGAMLATPEGRIVLGEDDHLGCLFSYFPPLP